MTLRNKHLGRSSHIIKEEEVEFREQAKKKINEIEELKEAEFQSVKTLEDLNFLKHKEVAAIAEIEQKLIRFAISKKLISFFKESVIPKKYLHLAEELLKQYIMFHY